MPFPNPVNDRAADLLLLAKNHYPGATLLVERARRVVSFHNLYEFGKMKTGDVAHVVVHDLLPILLPTMSPHQLSEFLLKLGPQPTFLPGYYEHPEGFYAGLIQAVLEKAASLRVIAANGEVLLVMPSVDPFIAKVCAADDPSTCIEATSEQVA